MTKPPPKVKLLMYNVLKNSFQSRDDRAEDVALIFGSGLSILSMVVFGGNAKAFRNVDWIGVSSFAVAFFALRKLRWNPILTMCLCGVAGLGLHVLFGV